METIRGRMSHELDTNELTERIDRYQRLLLDLGTGDGRYARSLAEKQPDCFVIGVDACRENLRKCSQAKIQNLLFVIATAQSMPRELHGLVTQITINFPWGSLLESLLCGDPVLLHGLEALSSPAISLELRLNSGALAEAGTTLKCGAERICDNLCRAGWQIRIPMLIDARDLQRFPSTWAKRIAFGRDPRAILLRAHR